MSIAVAKKRHLLTNDCLYCLLLHWGKLKLVPELRRTMSITFRSESNVWRQWPDRKISEKSLLSTFCNLSVTLRTLVVYISWWCSCLIPYGLYAGWNQFYWGRNSRSHPRQEEHKVHVKQSKQWRQNAAVSYQVPATSAVWGGTCAGWFDAPNRVD